MQAVHELVGLANPISLPKLVKKAPEVIDLLSTSSDIQPSQSEQREIFP